MMKLSTIEHNDLKKLRYLEVVRVYISVVSFILFLFFFIKLNLPIFLDLLGFYCSMGVEKRIIFASQISP